MIALNGARSGPAISTMPFRGAARATSATMAATSSAALGWNRPGELLTMFPSALEAAMPPNEFQELGRADDGVGDAGGLDQFLLGDLGAEIAIVGPVDRDDGERDVVPDAGGGLRRDKVAPGSLEEFQHRPVFKRRRVGEVDHHPR